MITWGTGSSKPCSWWPSAVLGDMFGRVRIYNAGFVVFTIEASITCSPFDPFDGVATGGALWLDGLAGVAPGHGGVRADGEFGQRS